MVYWIHKLQESDSRLHKEDVLRQALEMAELGNTSCDQFLTYVIQAYNPYGNFYIRQVPEISEATGRENPWHEFNDLLYDLQNRIVTGNAARDRVEKLSQKFDSDEWNNFCRNVIRKDLRCGISDKTFNKVCAKHHYEIPVFGCQLATNCEGRPEMKGLKRLEPKLDGVRVLMRVFRNNYDEVVTTPYSRNGKIFENFNLIEQQISDNFEKLRRSVGDRSLNDGFWLDGEVTGHSFQELMRQARRKENVDARDSVFNIFDIIPTSHWERGHWNAQLHKRIDILERMRGVIDTMPNVELLPHIMVDLDSGEGRDQLHRYANDMVNAGFEGIMIKDINSPYECKRNTFWMKWKPTITVDLTVVELEEGTGRNKGRLGALVCEGIDDGKNIRVNVGSGYSDEDRDSYWADSKLVVGRTAEVLADAITQNQDGTYSLRFPRFVRFRDDK
jgi:DNA ligase 1